MPIPPATPTAASTADESDGPTASRATPQRLLDAAVEAAAIHGLARLSMGDVATRAGLSRQTLYKHYPSRDALIAAAVVREAERMVGAILSAAAAQSDPHRSLEVAVLTTLHLARDHPLLDRLVRTEPESLLPFLVGDGGVVVAAVRGVVEQLLDERAPGLDPVVVRRVADMATRLLISYAVNAPDDPPEVVAGVLADLVFGGLPTMADAGLVAPT